MVTKQRISRRKIDKMRVIFLMPAINGCACLYLVGKFDDWQESVYRMECADDGTWSLALELEPGREYQYRYRTDTGSWHSDPSASGNVSNPDGSVNSVVVI